MSNYNINIVKKPWGYEYLAYENKHIALWFLYIKHTHSTSLHCHPNKTTGLILLDGKAEVSFLNDTNKLNPIAYEGKENKTLEYLIQLKIFFMFANDIENLFKLIDKEIQTVTNMEEFIVLQNKI